MIKIPTIMIIKTQTILKIMPVSGRKTKINVKKKSARQITSKMGQQRVQSVLATHAKMERAKVRTKVIQAHASTDLGSYAELINDTM